MKYAVEVPSFIMIDTGIKKLLVEGGIRGYTHREHGDLMLSTDTPPPNVDKGGLEFLTAGPNLAPRATITNRDSALHRSSQICLHEHMEPVVIHFPSYFMYLPRIQSGTATLRNRATI
jgi:hypothetical protein